MGMSGRASNSREGRCPEVIGLCAWSSRANRKVAMTTAVKKKAPAVASQASSGKGGPGKGCSPAPSRPPAAKPAAPVKAAAVPAKPVPPAPAKPVAARQAGAGGGRSRLPHQEEARVQGRRFRRLSHSWRRPDPEDRRAGSRRHQARAVRDRLREGQDDPSRADA